MRAAIKGLATSELGVLLVACDEQHRGDVAALLIECSYRVSGSARVRVSLPHASRNATIPAQVHSCGSDADALQYLGSDKGASIRLVLKEHEPDKGIDGTRLLRKLARAGRDCPVVREF